MTMRALTELAREMPKATNLFLGTSCPLGGPVSNVVLFARLHAREALGQMRFAFHPRFVMVFCLQTQGVLSIGDQPMPIRPGEAILLAPYTQHRFEDFARPRIAWLFAGFEMPRPLPAPLGVNKVFAFKGQSEVLLQGLLTARAGGRQPDLAPWLTLLLTRHCLAPEGSGTDTPRAGAPAASVLTQVRAHLFDAREPVTSAGLARALGLSESSLRRRLRRETALPLQTVSREIQLEKARGLLMQRDLPIGDIAHICGFSSQSAFNRRFRAEMGQTPSAYRAKLHAALDVPE